MKRITRILSVILTLVMLMQPIAFAASVTDFLDFPNDWSTQAMTAAVDNGLLIGNGNRLIKPNSNLKRNEIASVITRAFGATKTADISAFTDVTEEDWFYNDVAKAFQMGAVNGTSETTFSPYADITREEVFTILGRILCIEGTNEETLKKFTDGEKVSEWAHKYIIGLVEKGYINGYTDGSLRPKDNMTRAELAQVFHNLFKTYISTAGYHSSVEKTGAVIVRASGAHLENVVINGDLIIADGVGEGEFTLSSVTVNGRILVRGGEGKGKITFKNVTATEGILVYNVNGTVNFNNYQTDLPFKNLTELTPANFLKKEEPVYPGSSGSGSSYQKHTVSFWVDSNMYREITVRHGNTVSAPSDPTKDDYKFIYWSENSADDGNGQGFDFSTRINSSKDLYAIFKKIHTITFNYPTGTKNIDVVDGEYIDTAEIPSVSDTSTQRFVGWTDGIVNISSNVIGSYIFTADMVLEPWYVDKDIKTVTFMNGNSTYDTKEVENGSTVSAPSSNPSKTGATFKHWGTTASAETGFDFSTAISTDLVLHAVYEYTVTFVVGTNETPEYVIHGHTVSQPTTPQAPLGQQFLHWSLTENGTTAYDFSTEITDSVKIYAVFETIPTQSFTVKFEVGGNEVYSENVIKGNSVLSVPANPADTTDSYFVGWYIKTDSTQTVVDVASYKVESEIVFVAKFVAYLKVSFYDLSLSDTPIHTAFVKSGATLADNQYPHHEDNLGESSLDMGVVGYVKNATIDPVYAGVDYAHKIPLSYWYIDTDKLSAFDSTYVITQDTDVYLNIKETDLRIGIPKIEEDFKLSLYAYYDSETRIIDTIKDALFINEDTINRSIDRADDKFIKLLADKGIINDVREGKAVMDSNYNIYNFEKYIKLVDILGEERINTLVWEVAGDSIDTTEVADWIKNNFKHMDDTHKNELVNVFNEVFDQILSDSTISGTAQEKLKATIRSCLSSVSKSDIITIINQYIDNHIAEEAYIEKIVDDMLKSFKNEDETALKELILDVVCDNFSDAGIKKVIIDYFEKEIKNGNKIGEFENYIATQVSQAEMKALVKAIVAAQTDGFELVEDALTQKLKTDNAFLKSMLRTAIIEDNGTLVAKLETITGQPLSLIESNADIADEMESYIDNTGLTATQLNQISAEIISVMKIDESIRNSAIDTYITDVYTNATVSSLADDIVSQISSNKSLFDNSKVKEILDEILGDKLSSLDENDPLVEECVESLVENEDFYVIEHTFTTVLSEDARHLLVSNIIDEIYGTTTFKNVLDTIIDKIFETKHIDDNIILYFIEHLSDENQQETLNTFIDTLNEIFDDSQMLSKIASALGQEDSIKQTTYVNQIIDELCHKDKITVTQDRLFMFEPILEMLEGYSFDFIEGKIPAKLKGVLPMEHIEELFTRFYSDPNYGYVAQLKKAMADAQANPTQTYYIGTGVNIMINPISDLFTPALEHALDINNELIKDKFPKYEYYYELNPYVDAIENYLSVSVWFNGSDNGFVSEDSGYSLKGHRDYYDIMKKLAVLVDDALLYYYNDVPQEDRDEIINAALTKVLLVANVLNSFLVDYAENGLPENLEDFVQDIETNPELSDYLERFGLSAYINKITNKDIADKVFDSGREKIMARFGSAVNQLLDKFAQSKLNRVYDDNEREKAIEALRKIFSLEEDADVYTVDTPFDFFEIDYKKIEKKDNTIEVERKFWINDILE